MASMTCRVCGLVRRCSSRKCLVVASLSSHCKTTHPASSRALALSCCNFPTSGSASKNWEMSVKTNYPKRWSWSADTVCLSVCLSDFELTLTYGRNLLLPAEVKGSIVFSVVLCRHNNSRTAAFSLMKFSQTCSLANFRTCFEFQGHRSEPQRSRT